MTKRIARRNFLKASAAIGAGVSLIPSRLAFGYAANARLNVALIGCGGRGSWFVSAVPSIGENLVAMCDVNEARAAESYRRMPDVPKYSDYRKMLDKRNRQIDAVVIAAPDHIHAAAGVMAMKMGKHLFCEKPLTNTIHEARVMRETARATGVATQMGNQGTATNAFREQVEIIRSGDLGEIYDVYVWNCQGGSGPQRTPDRVMPCPKSLDWDLWLGPRAERPYNRDWMEWHTWREFGTCQLGNWGVHSANMAFMGLQLHSLWQYGSGAGGSTIRVRAEVSEIERLAFPRWEIVHYDFPSSGLMPPVSVHWYNGIRAPGFRETIEPLLGRPLEAGSSGPWRDHAGCLVVGTKGTIHSTGHNSTYKLLPKAGFVDYKLPEPTLPRHGSHEQEWMLACRGGPAAMSNFDYGSALTEFVLLGNVATQFHGMLEYNPAAMKIVNNDEADRALYRDHRAGWTIA